MKKQRRQRIWPVYGRTYVSYHDQPFTIEKVGRRPSDYVTFDRIRLVTFSKPVSIEFDEDTREMISYGGEPGLCIESILEFDLTMSMLSEIDRCYGVFVEWPRDGVDLVSLDASEIEKRTMIEAG